MAETQKERERRHQEIREVYRIAHGTGFFSGILAVQETLGAHYHSILEAYPDVAARLQALEPDHEAALAKIQELRAAKPVKPTEH